MKYRKKPSPDKCDVARCRKPPFEDHAFPNGPTIRYCRDHGHEAAKLHFSETFEVRPIEQALVPAGGSGTDLGAGEIVTPELIARIEAERKAAEAELAELVTITLETDEEAEFGEAELARVRDARKARDAERKKATGPFNEGLRVVNGWFQPDIKALLALEGAWSSALGKYRAGVEIKRQALLRAAEEAAREAEAAQALPPPQSAQEAAQAAEAVQALQTVTRDALIEASETQPAGKATYIDRWRWEVTDASLIPREYLCPDERAIGTAVKESGEATVIPGIKVWNDPIVRPSQ